MRSYLIQSIKTSVRSAYTRITLNRITTAFFIFSFIHCFAQGIIQSFLFSVDSEYGSLLSAITSSALIPVQNLTYLEGSHGNFDLRICNAIPLYEKRVSNCTEIFRSNIDVQTPSSTGPLNMTERQEIASYLFQGGLTITPVPNNSAPGALSLNLAHDDEHVTISSQCAQILLYPQQIMRNSAREDLTFILLQFWLFAVSVMAVMYDSVPHTLTVLVTRALMTGWSMYAVWRTNFNESIFEELIYNPGTPCSINLFPDYFRIRVSYEIPDLILNITALLIASYLSWTLLQVYNTQSFKCVGAPEHIVRINRFFMAVLACLQLEAFVLTAAMGLWVDVLVNTAIAHISSYTPAYEGLFVTTTVILIPWIAMGWYAIRREMRRLMVSFLALGFLIMAGWGGVMFYSRVYRWSFLQWPFLGCFTVGSLTLIGASMILGLICRLNFGKGLAQYLRAEDVLASSNFAPEVFKHDEEKGTMDLEDIKSPYVEQPLPTYNPPTLGSYHVPYNVPF